MTCWSIGLAITAAVLALGGITLTVLGYLDAKREQSKPSEYNDVTEIRRVIGDFVLGASLWKPFAAVGLTAASVIAGAASSIVGSLA